VHYKFRQNLKPVGENQSIFITILNCKQDEKARWAALTVHKGSYLHYRPFVHKHDQAQKSLSMRLRLNAVCTKVPKEFFLNIAFICNISLFCVCHMQGHNKTNLEV